MMSTQSARWTPGADGGAPGGVMERAAQLLRDGGLVAFPTETVYGLAVRADCSRAVRRLYAAKGRPESKGLIVHVATIAQARPLATPWSAEAERLAQHFWPGPLTLVLPRTPARPSAGATGGEDLGSPALAPEVTAGGATVALRCPAHPAAQALLAACDFPVAAPSANPSGLPPPLSAAQVLEGLGGRIPLIIDGGEVGMGTRGPRASSTIVDLSCTPARLLREGRIDRAEIARLVPLEAGPAPP